MKQERKNIYRLILVQAIGLVLVSLLIAGIATPRTAVSVLLGGSCCLLPTFYFAYQLFRHARARAAYQAVQTLYIGELVKLIFMGCLCVFVFKFIPINPLAFFIGFLATQFMFWCAPVIYRLRRTVITGGIA
jgi:F0F1-type ATP synthase assembly protein I